MNAVPFEDALRVWLRVAALSFGGPAGQIAVMHRIVVEERGWLDERRFLHALNYCMLLPGPEAMQLATYIGWLMHGVRGGVVAGALFVMPGFLSILALSILYASYRELAPVAALFFGIKAAVVAIVIAALLAMARKALDSAAHVAIAGSAFVAIYAFDVPFPWIVIGAALIGLVGALLWPALFIPPGGGLADDDGGHGNVRNTRGAGWARSLRTGLTWGGLWLAPVIALYVLAGPEDTFTRLAVFFSHLAVVSFGGAYAALAYMAQEAVQTQAWLSAGEMVDGLGLAETTPGPLIQVTQFVGYLAGARDGGMPPLAGGVLASLLVTWVTFLPCFLWIFLGAPFIERLWRHPVLQSALGCVTAAVTGVILNLSIWFSLHVLFSELDTLALGPARLLVPVPASLDVIAAVIAASALLALTALRQPLLPVLLISALAGAAGFYWFRGA